MVLGKRSRHSLPSKTSSPTPSLSASTSTRHSTPACSSSILASSVPPSPTPSCKRARTRSSDVGDFCDKENEAPPNWYVCGRPADRDEEEEVSMSLNASNTESDDVDARQLSARELRAQRRTSSRVVSTRSRLSLPGPATPPITPSHRRSSGVTRHDTIPRTPSLHLSSLSLNASTDSLQDEMDVDQLSSSTPTVSPTLSKYARARTLLRSGASLNPSHSVIAARANERSTIENFITSHDFLSRDQNATTNASAISSLYISGSPGTGKTALVLDILQQIQSRTSPLAENADNFASPCCIYVNCMGLADVSSIWLRACEELIQSRGYNLGKSKAKSGDARKSFEDILTRETSLRCVLVLDELDYVSKTPSALSEIYQLSASYPSVLRLIGISNTLTLGSSASSGLPSPSSTPSSSKVFGPQQSLNFSAYNANDLLVILQARLRPLGEQDMKEIINLTALNFLCKKVAAQNGDLRYAMSVLRKCLDSAEKTGTPNGPGRVEMKHVLESLRAHESGSSSILASSSSNTPADPKLLQSTSKGSGVSRAVRGLGLHARLALVAVLVGWKRLEAGLPLTGPSPAPSFKSPSKSTSRSPAKRSFSSSSLSFSSSQSNELLTSSSLHTFYSYLLTSSYITPDGNHEPATPFNPISRSEFQDVLGVLETSGLVGFSLTPPIISTIPSPSTSTQSTSPLASSPTKGVFKTPSKPKRSTSFALPTPSRSGRGKAVPAAGESFVVLREGVREDEIVRGLLTSTAPSGAQATSGGQGAVEREIERLWEREKRKISKDVERRDWRASQEQEKTRLEREAIRDGVELGFDN